MKESLINLARTYLTESRAREYLSMKKTEKIINDMLIKNGIFLHELVDWSASGYEEQYLVSSIGEVLDLNDFLAVPGEKFLEKLKTSTLSDKWRLGVPFSPYRLMQIDSKEIPQEMISIINSMFSSEYNSHTSKWSDDFKTLLTGMTPENIANWMEESGVSPDTKIGGKSMIDYFDAIGKNNLDYGIFGLSPDSETQKKYNHLATVKSWCLRNRSHDNMDVKGKSEALLMEIYEEKTITKTFLKKMFKKYPDPEIWRQEHLSSHSDDNGTKKTSLAECIASMKKWYVQKSHSVDSAIAINPGHRYAVEADNIYSLEKSPMRENLLPREINAFGETFSACLLDLRRDFNQKSLMNQKSDVVLEVLRQVTNPQHIISTALRLTADTQKANVFKQGPGNVRLAGEQIAKIIFSAKNRPHFASLFREMHQKQLSFNVYSLNCLQSCDKKEADHNITFIAPEKGSICSPDDSVFGMAFSCYRDGLIKSSEFVWFLKNSFTYEPPSLDTLFPVLIKEPPEVLKEIVSLYFYSSLPKGKITTQIDEKLAEIEERKNLHLILEGGSLHKSPRPSSGI